VFEQSATAMTVSSLQFPPKQATFDSTSNLFKKQRLRLNPTFFEPEVSNIAFLHGIQGEPITVDNDDASDNDLLQMDLEADVNSVASYESFGAVDSFSENQFIDTTEAPADDSDYACFTSSQKCITSLIHLLDEDMECPDYAFKCIMDWAHNCFEAGFDFNPKSKTRLGNLKWMYDSLHDAKPMLPNVMSIQLPDPLPDTKSTDVICYDFVPQLLLILQNKEMMSANNLALDPNNPLAMYKPQNNRLGEALSGSVYQDMYQRLVLNPTKQLLCPLICYTDGTQIDALSQLSVEPFFVYTCCAVACGTLQGGGLASIWICATSKKQPKQVKWSCQS
jgi:hypothetical protein